MITSALLTLLHVVLDPVFGLLPTLDLTPLSTVVTGAGETMGAYAGRFDAIFPVHELFTIAAFLLSAVMPAVLAYVLGNWVWRHIPDIGGFGPGAG